MVYRAILCFDSFNTSWVRALPYGHTRIMYENIPSMTMFQADPDQGREGFLINGPQLTKVRPAEASTG